MCSIISNKINKDLTNIVRNYLSSISIKKYFKLSTIQSQSFYLYMKRRYPNILITKSSYLSDTLLITCRYEYCYVNIYNFPYQDICKISSKDIREVLYDKTKWNNNHLFG